MHMGVSPGRTVTHKNFDYDVNEKVGRRYGQPETMWALIGSATMDGESDGYSWDRVSVFQHKKSRALAIAHDSGCSCYSPFEDLTVEGVTFLSRLADFDQFLDGREKMIKVYDAETRTYSAQRHPRVVDQIVRLREHVSGLIRKQRSAGNR